MRQAVAFLALAACCTAHAQWFDKQGEILADTEDRKAHGAFGAELVFTTDAAALQDRWNTPSDTVNVDSVNSVRINEPISAFIVFSGCKPGSTGKCDVSMDFLVIQPDGKIYAKTPSMEIWRDKTPPRNKALALSVQYLRIRIEPHDPRGRYEVRVQVHDENSGNVLALKKSFIATSD